MLVSIFAGSLGQRVRLLSVVGVLLAWAQFGAGLLDALENYALIRVLLGSQREVWPVMARWCAVPKFLIVALGLVYVGVGTLIAVAVKLAGIQHKEVHMKPALLVVDVQKKFFEFSPTTAQSLNDAIEYINAAIALFREKHLPVICIQHMDAEEKLVPGEEGFELPDELDILPSDLQIHKTYGNSFNKTPLENELRELGVDTVIITGFCAEYCVLSTYRGAQDLDLTPIILRGSLASGIPENIKFVESISDIVSYGTLKKILG
jgi:nicotinamidase-related amidase